MSGAYIFVSSGSQEAYTDLRGNSYDESSYRRYALLHIEDIEVAKDVAEYMNENHGLSADTCDDWREFEAISEADLSKKDSLKTRPLHDPGSAEKRPEDEKELIGIAQKAQKHIEVWRIPAEMIKAQTQSGSVILLGDNECPIVKGTKKEKLSGSSYKLIKELIEAGEDGLTKDTIERASSAARRTLKRLREDKDWQEVIEMAEKTGRGYRIT